MRSDYVACALPVTPLTPIVHGEADVGPETLPGLVSLWKVGWIFEHFDIPVQAEMIGGILSVIPKGDMPKYVPWIVRCQSPEAAVAYVSILQKNAPLPVFEAAKGWIQKGVSAERCALLTEKIPELST